MLLHHPNLRIWLYDQPADMRKQFDGLAALTNNQMNGKLDEQHLFVFMNRKRTQIKLLYYSSGGLCLWSKRLEKGQFQKVQSTGTGAHKVALDWSALQCLIDGINWLKAPRMKRSRQAQAV